MSKAKEIAQERFARGEITAEEYDRIINRLDLSSTKENQIEHPADEGESNPERLEESKLIKSQQAPPTHASWQSIRNFSHIFNLILVAYSITAYKVLQQFAFPETSEEIDQTLKYLNGTLNEGLFYEHINIVLAFILFGVILIWIYRLTNNLFASKVPHLSITPGWSVGWFFVPVAFFWKPYQAVGQIVRSTNYGKQASAGVALSAWWICYWLSFFLVMLAAFLVSDPIDSPLNSVVQTAMNFQVGAVVVELIGYILIVVILDKSSKFISAQAGIEYKK